MDRTKHRPTETEVMALLEQVISTASEAESFIQDDSKITGNEDRRQIRERMMHIRALTFEIERILDDGA
jgi:replicative DNA helicase